jgi:hypothetical protein
MKFIYEFITNLVHFIFGVITSLVSFYNNTLSLLFMIVYVLYQLIDYLGDKDTIELKNDILEYASGLVTGLFLYVILVFY